MLDLNLNSPYIIHYWWLFLITFARFYGAMFICPIFNTNYLTKTLKVALSLLFAAIIFPSFTKVNFVDTSLLPVFLIAKEFIYGLLLSYLISFPLWIMESAGNIIDTQRGEQFAAAINPMTNNQDSSIGKLMVRGFTTYFVNINGLLFFLNIVFKSFIILPVEQIIPQHFKIEVYINFFSMFFYWAIMLVLPLILLMFILEFTMGLISSFIPQLNVTVLSMPLKSAVALWLLIYYLGTIYHEVVIQVMGKLEQLYG